MVFAVAVVEVDDGCTVVVEVDFAYNNSAGAVAVAGHSRIVAAVGVAVGHNTTAVVAVDDYYIAAVAVLPSWHYYHLHHSNYSEGVVELCPEVEDDTVIVYS